MCAHQLHRRDAGRRDHRRLGFTLIELLVAITVLLILATLTFTMVNVTSKGDQVRSAARQVQSFLEGSRDRAAHAKAPVGVRFVTDPKSPNNVTGFVYIGVTPEFTEGKLALIDNSADPRHLLYFNGALCASTLEGWAELVERDLLRQGATLYFHDLAGTRILVPYTIAFDKDSMTGDLSNWRLTKTYAIDPPRQDTDMNGTDDRLENLGYDLALRPAVLPNQEPRLLPAGIVIDLAHSRIPSTWTSNELDLLFSPSGTATGLAASAGQVHLVLADVRDVESGRGPTNSSGNIDDANLGQHLVVTVTTKTGKISTHPIFFGSPADPFRFAELGEESK